MTLPEDIDVREIRARMNLSRAQFSRCFSIPVATLRHWENGERKPRGTARILLLIVARHPQAVLHALKAWEFRQLCPYPPGIQPITRVRRAEARMRRRK